MTDIDISPEAVEARLEVFTRLEDWGSFGSDEMGEIATLIRALRSALTASEQQRTWQPIETAPKDGTSILIYGGTYNDNEGYYHDMECRFPTLAFWSGNYMPHWHGDNLDGHDRWNVHQPTHWMPLPEAPK